MTYLITFLEGIITFVSPCLLPMIPIYVTYFAAGEEVRTSVVLRNALGFVLGFTCVFIAMGALASSVGAFFIEYQSAVNVVVKDCEQRIATLEKRKKEIDDLLMKPENATNMELVTEYTSLMQKLDEENDNWLVLSEDRKSTRLNSSH